METEKLVKIITSKAKDERGTHGCLGLALLPLSKKFSLGTA